MDAPIYSSDVAFTPSVKAVQARKGSREAYRRVEERGAWQTRSRLISPLSSAHRPAFFSRRPAPTASPTSSIAAGRPASFMCSTRRRSASPILPATGSTSRKGNLAENPKAHLFLIDYANRRRVKIWGEARVVEDDAALTAKLMPEGYKARAEQAILFTVSAWDCELPAAYPAALRGRGRAAALAERDQRIEALEAEIARLTEAR